jgi:predicted alpha/beta hydrolase family esterase
MLKSDIISYDYTLPSTQTLLSSPSQYTFIEDKLSSNLEHVLDYITNTLHLNKENLILMSHSFGSVPTLYNASSEEYQNIAGIVLVSPMFGYEKTSDDDVNTVIPEHSLNFSCNCFVVHGVNDKVVSMRKVERMCKQIRNCKWMYADGCGHFDLFCGKDRWKVYDKVRQFINMCGSVREGKGNGCEKELDSTRVSEVVNVSERISKMKEQEEDSYNDIESNFIM